MRIAVDRPKTPRPRGEHSDDERELADRKRVIAGYLGIPEDEVSESAARHLGFDPLPPKPERRLHLEDAS